MVVMNFAIMFLYCHAYEKKIRGSFWGRALSETMQRTLITNIAILHKLWYTYGQGI